MKEIQLTKGFVALVDDEDYPLLSQHSWCADEIDGRVYATRRQRVGGRAVKVYMHRDIMGAVKGDEIDHRVGVGLDNQKHNLRKATRSQQRANQGPRKDNRQGFKGVKANRDKWAARITHKGHRYHLGVFLTVEDAAKAYAAKAREFYGEFARVA